MEINPRPYLYKTLSIFIFGVFLVTVFILSGKDVQALEQPLPCTAYNGQPVPYIANNSLNNVGIATTYNGNPVIVMNPNILNQFSPLVQIWWFAHECGHHALLPNQNNEVNADCFATRALVSLNYINSWSDLQQIMNELSQLPGSIFTGHLPGPGRAQVVRNCAGV